MQAAIAGTGIISFSFDDLSATASELTTDYPLLHVSIPKSKDIRFDREDWDIEAFVFVKEEQANKDERLLKWDEAKNLMRLWIKNFIAANKLLIHQTTQQIAWTPGHTQFNDELIGIKAEFTITIPLPIC